MGIQRRVALIGSGQGPWISTKGLAEPRAKVTGLKGGGEVKVLIRRDAGSYENDRILRIVENGVYVLHEAEWMQVSCENGGRGVICDILTKKAVA